MKIALLSAFYPYRGGIAQFSAMLYRALEKDHELKAYTFKRQYPNILFPGTTQVVTQDDDADPIEAFRVLDSVNPVSYGNKFAQLFNRWIPEMWIHLVPLLSERASGSILAGPERTALFYQPYPGCAKKW